MRTQCALHAIDSVKALCHDNRARGEPRAHPVAGSEGPVPGHRPFSHFLADPPYHQRNLPGYPCRVPNTTWVVPTSLLCKYC